MRPPTRTLSALRFPLNHILGTEANVRALRVIFLSDIPIGVSELARRTRLQVSGVARVCTRLEDLGVIEAVGRGARNRQYRRSSRFALGNALTDLFARERARAESVFRDLQELAKRHLGAIRAAWIEGPVATETDTPDDVLVLGIMTEPQQVDDLRLAVREALLRIQAQHEIPIELKVHTLADLATVAPDQATVLREVRPLLGPPPLDIVAAQQSSRAEGSGRAMDHHRLDARALEIARSVAERIKQDPSIVEDARRYIERRLPVAAPGERLTLEEWRDILDTMSPPRLRRFLVRDDERATRLRQSLPFLDALSPSERQALIRDAGSGA
jgi:hypothetical protein